MPQLFYSKSLNLRYIVSQSTFFSVPIVSTIISIIFVTCWTFERLFTSMNPLMVLNRQNYLKKDYQKVKINIYNFVPSSYAYRQSSFGKTDNDTSRCLYESSGDI